MQCNMHADTLSRLGSNELSQQWSPLVQSLLPMQQQQRSQKALFTMTLSLLTKLSHSAHNFHIICLSQLDDVDIAFCCSGERDEDPEGFRGF